MSRKGKLLLLLVAAVAIGVGTAWAESPHFISASASKACPNLVASFKIAGLGSVPSATITLSGQATATYVCINGGGQNPSAANKETVTAPVTVSGTFPVRNGQTTGSLTLTPPGPGSFQCPPGQTLVLAMVTYQDVTVCFGTLCASLGTSSCP